MSRNSANNAQVDLLVVPQLIAKLCEFEAKNVPDDYMHHLQRQMCRILGSRINKPLDEADEFYIMEKIKMHLAREGRETDVLRFEELYYQMKRLNATKHPASYLLFLFNMLDAGSSQQPSTANEDGLRLSVKPGLPPLHLLNFHEPAKRASSVLSGISGFSGHTGTGMTRTTSASRLKSYASSTTLATNLASPMGHHPLNSPFNPQHQDIARLLPLNGEDPQLGNHFMPASPHRRKSETSERRPRPHTIHFDSGSSNHNGYISEQELIREILMTSQGLNGKIIMQDPNHENRFLISPQYAPAIHPSQRMFVERLTNLGWLYSKINRYCNAVSRDASHGQVCQSFASALKEELLDFSRLITIISQNLSEQLSSCNDTDGGEEAPQVTLQRLFVWTFDSFFRLKSLAILVDGCKGRRGGNLAQVVYRFMQQGDQQIKICVTRILSRVALPIRKMLSQWIFYGELDDPYGEFFIKKANVAPPPSAASTSSVQQTPTTVCNTISGMTWLEKYTLNESMMPGFINNKQAIKILATGKAIDLLRQVCGDSVTASVPGYEDLKKSFESTHVECLFRKRTVHDEGEGEFDALLGAAYQEISQKALHILFVNYKLMDHLKGLRKYLLLGQGDFIRHLMDLLAPELDKPAQNVKFHNVVPALENAIRSTNAQFDDPEITNRLDCRLLEKSHEESGWDIFTLNYKVEAPLTAILAPQYMQNYLRLFRHLWRSKHMEFILGGLWQQQMAYWRLVKHIPALHPVFHECHILLSEMMHFIQQMEYYITFEVMECSWAELLNKIEDAQDVDQLIRAHHAFLNTVTRKSMLERDTSHHSDQLIDQLRAVYDTIVQFKKLQEELWKETDREIEKRRKYGERKRMDAWSAGEEKVERERRVRFEHELLPKAKVRVGFLSRHYQDMVQTFLLQLADHPDADLSFLSFRLDFNEHYKRRDKRLETSFTYSRHRTSMDASFNSIFTSKPF